MFGSVFCSLLFLLRSVSWSLWSLFFLSQPSYPVHVILVRQVINQSTRDGELHVKWSGVREKKTFFLRNQDNRNKMERGADKPLLLVDSVRLADSTAFLSPNASMSRPSSASGRDRSQSRARAKSTIGVRGAIFHPVRIEVYKVGIYGWRKRFLYLLVLIISVLVIINAALILWIVRLLHLSFVRL